jgi:hypothetical protein
VTPRLALEVGGEAAASRVFGQPLTSMPFGKKRRNEALRRPKGGEKKGIEYV